MTLYVTFLIFIGSLLVTVGDIVIKYWVLHRSPQWYILGFALYIVALFFLIESFKYQNIAVASALFILLNVLILTLVTWLYFREPVHPLQLAGLALACGAIILLELG